MFTIAVKSNNARRFFITDNAVEF